MRAIDPNLELALHPASSCLQIRTNWDLSENWYDWLYSSYEQVQSFREDDYFRSQ